MNEIILKRASIFAFIFGACLGILSLVPSLIGFTLFILMFVSAPMIIIYMKKDKKFLNFLNNEQGAILGSIIGFASTIGFFLSFSPLVCVLKLIFKNYYAYMIPDLLSTALWLFVVLVFMVALVFSATNAASAMGLTWVYSHIEKAPDDDRVDIKIED